MLFPKADADAHPLADGEKLHKKYNQQDLMCVATANRTEFDILMTVQEALGPKDGEQAKEGIKADP